jgi:hypothetical protein
MTARYYVTKIRVRPRIYLQRRRSNNTASAWTTDRHQARTFTYNVALAIAARNRHCGLSRAV